jgi:microcystin-dependent protein
MTQATHDYSIANDTGSAVRTDLNTLFGEVETANSGTSAPSNLATGKLWYDTGNNLLKQYDGSSWVTIMDSTGGTFTGAVNLGVSGTGVALKADVSGTLTTVIPSDGTAQALGTGDSPTFANIVGMIAPFAMSSPPSGWITCDGSAVSRTTTYDSLFTAISTTWGSGDGSTTFNVPDLEGAFLRGVGTSTLFTQDQTISLATAQDDTMQGHYHNIRRPNGTTDQNTISMGDGSNTSSYLKSGNSPANGVSIAIQEPRTDGSNGTPRTANETRPNNIGVKYCIKY